MILIFLKLGFNHINLENKINININNTKIFIFLPNLNFEIYQNNIKISNFPYFFEIKDNIIIKNIKKNKNKLIIWNLPINFCGEKNYFISTKYSIKTWISTNEINQDFLCIFPNPFTNNIDIKSRFESTNLLSMLDFYEDIDKSSLNCGPMTPCSYSSNIPFLIKFSSINNSGILYYIEMINEIYNKFNQCKIELISNLNQNNILNSKFLKISDIECFSKYNK